MTESLGNTDRTREFQPNGCRENRKVKQFFPCFTTICSQEELVSLTIHAPPKLSSRELPDTVGLSLGVYQISGFLPSLKRLACRTMGLNCFSRIDARTSSWLSPFSDDAMSAGSKPCQQLVNHVSMLPKNRCEGIELP